MLAELRRSSYGANNRMLIYTSNIISVKQKPNTVEVACLRMSPPVTWTSAENLLFSVLPSSVNLYRTRIRFFLTLNGIVCLSGWTSKTLPALITLQTVKISYDCSCFSYCLRSLLM